MFAADIGAEIGILAVYIPSPEEFSAAILLLIIAYLVLCATSYWMKLSVPLAALLMAAGCAIAIGPDIYFACQAKPGSGDMARRISGANYSDAFFAITSYFHVGRGKLLALTGMSVAILAYAIVVEIQTRNLRKTEGV